MRALGIEALTVETAGQSSQGSLIQLAGIKDGRAFRDAVLAQRDAAVEMEQGASVTTAAQPPAAADGSQTELLMQIRDSLNRIETVLNEK